MSYKRILCAVDFSDASTPVFDTAAELAASCRAELHVVHVIEADPRPMDMNLEQKAIDAMKTLVAPAQEALGDKLMTELTTGRAPGEIVDRARLGNVDLVVIGARGLTLPEEGLHGRTMEYVVKHAPCSVLVVRGEAL